MPVTTGANDEAMATLADITTRYAAERTFVDTSFVRMRAVTAGRHTPADARRAANDLAAALRTATATATEALRLTAPAAHRPRRRLRRHRRASLDVPAPLRAWSAELVRLTRIAVWLRRETLDDLGVHVPTVVRVGSLAAIGPHIPGMGAEPAARAGGPAEEPRIGLDLAAVVDSQAKARAA